ncbi:hypothetical protein AB0D62_01695 [Streptomyces massasporeus]|uniref:hypothetical protein n=1 Tax=Streptomyces massasporeus TaxID=67324 RepID=UPI0033C27AB2
MTLVPALAPAAVRPDITLLRVLDDGAPARAVHAATPRGRSLSPAHGVDHTRHAILRPSGTDPPPRRKA